jgi:uncharacterized phage protein gp47/JayE
MPFGVTPSGFARKPLLTIQAEILDRWASAISSGIDRSPTGIEAQMAGAIAEQIDNAWLAAEAAYAARDPAQASGQALDDLLRLRGDFRRAATESLVSMQVTVAAGTYAAGSLVVTPVGRPTDRFASDAVLVAAIPGTYPVIFRAETAGPLTALAGTLTAIIPVSGFTAATNPLDAIPGVVQESDAEFFARSEAESTYLGSASAQAVRDAVSALAGVSYVRVYVNDLPTVDAFGVPGNSIEVVVRGGVDSAIAAAILDTKAGGIRAHGSTVVAATDSVGNSYSIGFTRPTPRPTYITVNVAADPATYAGDEALRTSLIHWGDSSLGVGMDVVLVQVIRRVAAAAGVFDATVLIGATAGTVTAANFVVGIREIADLDSTSVTVTHTNQTAPA